MHHVKLGRLLILWILLLIGGCNSADQRLASYAQQASVQQAQQNEVIASQSHQITTQSGKVTSIAQELIAQTETARRELSQSQKQLQDEFHAERERMLRQRAQIDKEQQRIALAAVRAPVIAQAVLTSGLVLAALLPLLVTAYAVGRLPDESAGLESLARQLLDDFNPLAQDPDSLPLAALDVSAAVPGHAPSSIPDDRPQAD
jgi:hypothetical protein